MTRIHVVSLPHTLLTRDYDWCAYTAKVRRFITMLDLAGIEAHVYGPDHRDPEMPFTSYTVIADFMDRKTWFGAGEWDRDTVFDHWDASHLCWRLTNARAARAISKNWRDGDIIGLIGGLCQQQLITEFGELTGILPLVTEWGIGYSGVIDGTHKVYESYAWMHHVAGLRHADDIKFYDTVIPNCFDPADYQVSAEPGEYLLYLGRPTARKGLPIIADIAARSPYPVIMAGQPGPPIPGTQHVGLVLGEEKANLLAGARALLCPTTYLEPFGGVAVEAMMSGTPVICTDYGAFTETVVHGQTGFRCRTLKDFMDAADDVESLPRDVIARRAITRYSIKAGADMYARYFSTLGDLYGEGWYAGAAGTLIPSR